MTHPSTPVGVTDFTGGDARLGLMLSKAHRYPLLVVLMLVALRLATGWHFFNEGVKKLDPGFSSAGFLNGAVGPVAPVLQAINPGPYDARGLLAKPVKLGEQPASETPELADWVGRYGREASKVPKGGPIPELEYPAEAPYAAWLDNIRAEWDSNRVRLSRVPGVSDEMLAATESIGAEKLAELNYYLFGEMDAIAELQHDVWRLEQMRAEASEAGPAPYLTERIDSKDADNWRAWQPWAKSAQQYEAEYIDAVIASFEAEEGAPSAERVRSALVEHGPLRWIDLTVMAVVLVSGVLLFLGLLTPFAAIMAACFLLSVMATQPPWHPYADTTYFFYQLVEVVALLLLAVVGAGRWAGLDGLYDRACERFNQNPTAAPATE